MGVVGERQLGFSQPFAIGGVEESGLVDDSRRLVLEHAGAEKSESVGRLSAPSVGGLIEGDTESSVAGGGDGGASVEGIGEDGGETVASAMSSEQGNDVGSVVIASDDEHGRLVALVGESGGEHANGDSRGAESDQRSIGEKRRSDVLSSGVESEFGVSERLGDALGELSSSAVGRED